MPQQVPGHPVERVAGRPSRRGRPRRGRGRRRTRARGTAASGSAGPRRLAELDRDDPPVLDADPARRRPGRRGRAGRSTRLRGSGVTRPPVRRPSRRAALDLEVHVERVAVGRVADSVDSIRRPCGSTMTRRSTRSGSPVRIPRRRASSAVAVAAAIVPGAAAQHEPGPAERLVERALGRGRRSSRPPRSRPCRTADSRAIG